MFSGVGVPFAGDPSSRWMRVLAMLFFPVLSATVDSICAGRGRTATTIAPSVVPRPITVTGRM
ncbi:MAG: hypothetical protein M3R02_06265 [Chloroflexota bacterium]|nr:hypothetical protein [Chloroflexota bacterium]